MVHHRNARSGACGSRPFSFIWVKSAEKPRSIPDLFRLAAQIALSRRMLPLVLDGEPPVRGLARQAPSDMERDHRERRQEAQLAGLAVQREAGDYERPRDK